MTADIPSIQTQLAALCEQLAKLESLPALIGAEVAGKTAPIPEAGPAGLEVGLVRCQPTPVLCGGDRPGVCSRRRVRGGILSRRSQGR